MAGVHLWYGEQVSELRIDPDRLQRALGDLGELGAYDDTRSGLRGVNRLALTDADAEGRRLVMGWFESAGLAITVDAIGNVYARREGREPALAPVMAGSHIDSVPTAGRFDGCLGVLGALEVVRTLDDHKVSTRRPLVIAFFTEEEGCRFGTDMLGSAVATGRISLEDAHALTDHDGFSVGDELARIGFVGEAVPPKPHAYVECHIEQGPVTRTAGVDIGVVTGVQAIGWHEVRFFGRAAHAGTTPNDYRADAGMAAARLNLELRRMSRSGDFGAEMLATMGVVQHHPGVVNVVPGRSVCTVDLRNPDDVMMEKAETHLDAFLRTIEAEDGVCAERVQTAGTPRARFDDRVLALIEEQADALGLRSLSLLSGAGHDAQEWANVCKTAMIFVPGENDGISHNPRELSTPAQCQAGIDVLLRTLVALANEE